MTPEEIAELFSGAVGICLAVVIMIFGVCWYLSPILCWRNLKEMKKRLQEKEAADAERHEEILKCLKAILNEHKQHNSVNSVNPV